MTDPAQVRMDDLAADGCCALDDGHDGPCEWRCDTCGGTGRCPHCRGTGGYDDVQRCTECDARYCPASCVDGWRVEEMAW